jgi:hypothetical protein
MGFDAVDIVPFDMDNFPAKLVRQGAADLGLDIIIEIGMPAHANHYFARNGRTALLEEYCEIRHFSEMGLSS